MATSLVMDIQLKRASKVYKEGDVIAGTIVVDSKGECSHQAITLTSEGTVGLQLSSKSVGVFEAFYNSVKPISLMNHVLEISKPGKLPSGRTEIPFEIPLKAKGNKKLYETYHGVYINVQYYLKLDMKRGMLNKDLHKEVEIIVESSEGEKSSRQPVEFSISPDSLQNASEKTDIPKFKIKGRLDSKFCRLTEPLTGEVVVESCDVPLKSIELQLVRIETCGCAEGYAKDATEIQNIQIADGDVARNLPIPLYMIFPRLFTAPTLLTNNFKLEFEVNMVVVFTDDRQVTENFPVRLSRF